MPANNKPTSNFADPQARESSVTGSSVSAPILILCAIVIPILVTYAFGTTNESQVVAAVIGLLAMMLIAAVPFWGLIVFTALLYIRPEESIHELAGMHLTLIVGTAAALGMLLRLSLDRKHVVRTPLLGMMTGFVIVGMVSGSTVGFGTVALFDFARLFMVVLLLVNLLRTRQHYNIFITFIIVSTTYLSIYTTCLYYSGGALMDKGLARSMGTGIFSDPNDLAATLIAGMVFTMSRIMVSSKGKRLLYLLLTLNMLFAVILTGSRGGLISVSVVMLGSALIMSKQKLLIGFVAITLILGVVVAAPGHMTNFDSKEESANSRFTFWNEALTQLKKNPVMGVGYQKFPDVNDGMVAHNSFVQCFAELGLPGFYFWMGCIYCAYRKRLGPSFEKGSEDSSTLLGARLALTGYLAACFWISRTYTPIMYVLISLPIAQQIAATGESTLVLYPPEERASEWGKVCLLCLGIILTIYLMVLRFK